MRCRGLYFGVVLLVGCRDQDPNDDGSGCTLAQDLMEEAVADLQAAAPPCESATDCVVVNTSLHCRNAGISGCGEIMHREAARGWDAKALCAKVDLRTAHSDLSCSIEASCAALGDPLCIAGRCVGGDELSDDE